MLTGGGGGWGGFLFCPNPPRYLYFCRVLEPLGPQIVGTWKVRVGLVSWGSVCRFRLVGLTVGCGG